jgi:4'-phosphopantetheinyl transferase EntD
LSHRDGRAAAIAAPAGALVGVDIERLDAIDSSHRRLFLTESERRAAADTSPIVLWTLKEAAWKALQLDGSVGFHELEVHLDHAGDVRGVGFREQWYSAVAAVVSPWDGYIMAVLHLERGR